ncbi:MAG: ATP-binding protein [Colwellia sp.]|nr:ATP-binding protein [Colwellia sp.]
MISFSQVLILLALYIISLFFLAQWGQSDSKAAKRIRNSANTYALSLAVFCTSWTFFGNIAVSTKQGLFPVALYLGTTLTFIFMTPLLKKMVLLKNEFHSTSIADFISVRYKRSQALAALISLLCVIGITPYLTIQLKSVIDSFQILTDNSQQTLAFLDYLDVIIVLMMAFFTIIFGVRHIDPTEKHPGMMVALAGESILKLLAMLIGCLWICYMIKPGVFSIFAEFAHEAQFNPKVLTITTQQWLSFMLIGALGIITLPRQFHVGIVECSDAKFLDRAKWLFPLYLLLINLFTFPVALAGLITPGALESSRILLLTEPLANHAPFIALITFLGGFAAATGMIMISAMTLSTMLTNHILMPVIMQTPALSALKRQILPLRWLMVFAILFLSLFYYRAIGDSQLIVNIGSISFVATAQFAPALIGGLIWRKGNLSGAFTGLSVGACVWFYCSLLPSLIRSGWLDWSILSQDSGFFYWLNPEQLFAIQGISPLTNGLIWSLLANVLCYVGVSLFTKMSEEEQKISHQFVDIKNIYLKNNFAEGTTADINLLNKKRLITEVFLQYLPEQLAESKLQQSLVKAEIHDQENINIVELSSLKNAALNALAGAIGMASSYKAFNNINLIDADEEEQLATYFSHFFAQLQLSPKELFEQVNFHQQKRELLESHAKQQLDTIAKLETEVTQRLKAEQVVNSLNEGLELRVTERTQALSQSNSELNKTLEELKLTQGQLLENEKMASLGGLVAGVAHEVNTPIGIVLTSISFMKEKCQTIIKAMDDKTLSSQQLSKFTEELEQGFDLSLRNISRAVELIEGFKLIAVDSVVDDARTLNVHDYLEDVLRSLRPKAKQAQVTIKLSCAKDIVINSYPGALAQITNNLIINSLVHAFTEQSDNKGEITIDVKASAQNIELIYGDNGCKLDENTKAQLFEPFYTTRRGQGGSGLGAHIVYNLVTQKLKGTIELITEQAQGKSFKITIPLTDIK